MERLAGWIISEPTNYQLFSGEVSRIAPISGPSSGVVNYEVTIRLEDLQNL